METNDKYIIIKVKDDEKTFTARINELIDMDYTLNGDLKIVDKGDYILYIQGMIYDEEDDYLEYEYEEDQDHNSPQEVALEVE